MFYNYDRKYTTCSRIYNGINDYSFEYVLKERQNSFKLHILVTLPWHLNYVAFQSELSIDKTIVIIVVINEKTF